MMSVSRMCRPLEASCTSPIEMPPTGSLIGTPASIRLRVAPQTEAIELEPFDSRMSETTRIVYGKLRRTRQNRRHRSLGKRPMPDLAPARARESA